MAQENKEQTAGRDQLGDFAPKSREQVSISNVTFEPRCRNNWHVHKVSHGGGQMLIGVAGRGWSRKRVTVRWRFFPARSSTFRPIRSTGTTADDTWFDHLAVEVPGRNTATEWLGPVTGPNTIGSGLNRSSAIESFPRCCGGWNGIRCPRTTQTGYAK